jgi:hypothetical protein
LQGVDEAPAIVQLNFARWQRLNPSYRMEILDQTAVNRLLAALPPQAKKLEPQALSDIVRTYLLERTGGIWVDASVYPAIPLDDWLPAHITHSGFFAFEKPGFDRPLSSWFLAATAENRMIRAWWKEVMHYWSVGRALTEGIPEDPVAAVSEWQESYPYFWFHYLFAMLIERDGQFAADWSNCVKVSAGAPHQLQGRFAQDLEIAPRELAALIDAAPVHKLNWRSPYPVDMLAAV